MHAVCSVDTGMIEVVDKCCGGLIRYIEAHIGSIDFSKSEWYQLYDVGMCARKDLQSNITSLGELFNLLDDKLPTEVTMEFRVRNIFAACARNPGYDPLPLIALFVNEFGVDDLASLDELREGLRVCFATCQICLWASRLCRQQVNPFPKKMVDNRKKRSFQKRW